MADSNTLNMAGQIARIERMQEATRKCVAEQRKLLAEALKLRRDHGLAPFLLAVPGMGGVAGFAAAVGTVLEAMGHP